MHSTRKIRVGLMGFGQVGRQFYRLASASDDIEIVAVSDIGDPAILCYLLNTGSRGETLFSFDGRYLTGPAFRSRMLLGRNPNEVPWDIFNVDIVVDVTRRYNDASSMQQHLNNGAPRVLISAFPTDDYDRIVVPGLNMHTAEATDRRISAASGTSAALCLLLQAIHGAFGVNQASYTAVHAFTSDQPAQDYAGSDIRRSRSAAQNIIPNTTAAAAAWYQTLLPALAGCVSGFALHVPVQRGSLLDLDIALDSAGVTTDEINQALTDAAAQWPDILATTADPIVSSDVRGRTESALIDLQGTLRAGKHLVKVLAWYDSSGHAARLLDVVRHYAQFDASANVRGAA